MPENGVLVGKFLENKDIVLDIFGDGYLREHFQSIIETENMSEYIHLKGHLEQKNYIRLCLIL